mmetsp:Transcript_26853/g.30007  ORF Transcript_26853/g.30007 Transcript_26853/m.30007 type:complete len:361 (+) Transcript_26853:63-1145(+)
MLISPFHHHVVVVTLAIALASTIGVTVGDKVGVTSPDEHTAIEEARNLVKKGKKTKRSKDDSVQQQDDDDALEATINLLSGQIKLQQEVISLQQQELMDLHDQCTSDSDPKEKSARFLYVQTASNCELRQLEGGRVTVVGNMSANTYVFSDRPHRWEYNLPTVNFVDMFSFNRPFQNDPPNAAITAVSNDSDQFVGPAVIILSNALMLADGSVSYDITQSEEQDIEMSLASFFKTGSVVQFTHCSIFIDSAHWSGDNTCVPATGSWGGKSFQSADIPFETCYKDKCQEKECWSKSKYSDKNNMWMECWPRGAWTFLNSGAATSTCGSPCHILDQTLDDDYGYDSVDYDLCNGENQATTGH